MLFYKLSFGLCLLSFVVLIRWQRLLLHFEVVKNVFVDWSFSYQDRLGNYQSVDGEFHSYNPVVISDLRIQPQIGKLKLFVEASNLFDQKYNDIGNVKQPGRWIKAGLSINLNYKTPQL